MDYKYIEQLIERYFQCETTLQEEQILKAFFAQDEQEVPQQLRQYEALFAALRTDTELGEDFDESILSMTEPPKAVKARTISLTKRLQPLFRAAAVVAIVLTLGNAINIGIQQQQSQIDEADYAAYRQANDDAAVAYEQIEDGRNLPDTALYQRDPMSELAREVNRSVIK